MAYVPPKYPGAIPTIGDLPNRADDVDWMYAARYNELKKELRAIMIELGVDPAGAQATVVARLNTLGVGDVVGPGAALDEAIVRYHGTSGKIIQATLGAKIDDTGRLTNTAQPSFCVFPTSPQSNLAVAAVTIVFDNERFDQGNNFASNTFTAPVTGKYLLALNLNLAQVDIDATVYVIYIITSNKNYEFQIDPDGLDSDPAYWCMTLSVLADMDVNDTAHIVVSQTGGAQQTDVQTASCFSGCLLA